MLNKKNLTLAVSLLAALARNPDGVADSQKVLADYAEEYGQEMADVIAGYKDTNFNMA